MNNPMADGGKWWIGNGPDPFSDRRAEAHEELDRMSPVSCPTPEAHGDRRTEAFAVLDNDSNPWPSAALTALRSVLERHREADRYGKGICDWCECASPCPDETDAINALLGEQ